MYWRVNYAKFNVLVRNKVCEHRERVRHKLTCLQLLVAAACDRFNKSAGEVLRATLKCAEPKTNNVTDVRSGALYHFFRGGI